MKRTKVVAPVLVGLVLTLSALAAAACSSSTPTPTPTQTQPGQPTTTQPPAPATTRFIMNGGSPFYDWYITVVRRIMEEQAQNVRVDVQAVGGIQQILAQLGEDPNLIPRMMINANEATLGMKPLGLWPPQGSYNPPGDYLMGMGQFPASQRIIMTLDKNIKSIYDLDGVSLGHSGVRGDEGDIIFRAIFEEIGVEPRWVYGPSADTLAQLHSGTIKARTTGIIYEGVWAAGGNIETAKQRWLGIVHMPDEVIEAVAQKKGWDFLYPVHIYGSNVQKLSGLDYDFVKDGNLHNGEYVTGSSGISVMWAFHESAPEAAVYEFIKTFLENLDYFEGVYPGSLDLYKQRVGHAFIPQDKFHPGARRAYEELGVTYGVEGVQQWEAAGGRAQFYVR